MATRIYLPTTGTAPVTPSTWNFPFVAGTNYTLPGKLVKSGTSHQNTTTATGTVSPRLTGVARYVIGPLSAVQISGIVNLAQRCSESNSGANTTLAIAIKIITPAGADRSVLLAAVGSDSAASPQELLTSLAVRRVWNLSEVRPIPLTAQTPTAGDYLVIEIGFRSATTTTRNIVQTWGDNNANDLPDADGGTNDYDPWVDFSQTLSWQATTYTKTLSLDSYLKQIYSRSSSLDAILYAAMTYTKIVSLDSLLNKIGLTRSSSFDALLQKLSLTKTSSFDAFLYKILTKTLGIDGYLQKGSTKSLSVDSFLMRVGLTKIASIDSFLQKLGLAKNVSINALLQKLASTQVTSLDAFLIIGGESSKSILIDSLLLKLFSDAAFLDALVTKEYGVSASFDAILGSSNPFSIRQQIISAVDARAKGIVLPGIYNSIRQRIIDAIDARLKLIGTFEAYGLGEGPLGESFLGGDLGASVRQQIIDEIDIQLRTIL